MIVTVVTPTLNGKDYLEECILSAERNNSKTVEVEHLIVDGGSTDGTVELAESHGLRVLKGKDSGIFDAINKGSFNSSGELLGFLGADDVMLPGALDPVVALYERSGRRWVVGGIRWIDQRGRSLGELAAPPSWMTPRMHVCLGWNPIMHMATYFSRAFYTELSGFNIDYKVSGDYEMFTRALSVAPYARLRQPVACFRRTGANTSATQSARGDREIQQFAGRYGPRTDFERRIWRSVLKARLNFGNPQWLVSKLASRSRQRLGGEQAYF